MHIIQLKRQVLGIIIGMGVIVLPQSGYAVIQNQDEQCSKDILLAYFPEVFVRETLKNYHVPKDQWDAITSELNAKDRDIIKQVEVKAEKITPNPLKDPQQRQAAVKLFRDTLLENFSSILKAHGVTDDKQIQAMLDDIQQQKAKRFAQCMESQKTQVTPSAANLKNSQNEEANDEDINDDEENDDSLDSHKEHHNNDSR